MAIKVIKLKSIDSTSTYARKNALHLNLPALIIADEQTCGRGRHGKTFLSPQGGLYMTLLFEADSAFDCITPAAALCVMDAVKEFTGISLGIKWVNDLYLNEKKVCGILTERFESGGRTLTAAGIGINLTTESFPADLPKAGSIGADIPREKLALSISEKLLAYNADFNKAEIRERYAANLFITGREVSFEINGVSHTGKAFGINGDFNLLVDCAGEIFTLSSGEISLKIR